MTNKAIPSAIQPASEETCAIIQSIGEQFAIAGEYQSGAEIQSGLINTTFLAAYRTENGQVERYILQKINAKVFKNPRQVMANVEKVTRHINWKVLRVRRDGSGQTLNLYPARGGRCYIQTEDGSYWRCYNYIEGTHTYDVVENTRQAYQAAYAFGAFQDLVSDLPAEDIHETIPDFHNTRARFNRLMEVAKQDPKDRLLEVMSEFDFICQREAAVDHLLNMQASGVLPTRITHNDTKINNVLMDQASDQAVCVIDLDTVMPGLSLYDFGDMVRTATSPAAEDETDLSKVTMQMPMFEALVEGYLDAAHGFLCDAEIAELAFSGKLIALEIGIRFLTDYLEGDVYFKIKRPHHNLDRCRTQLKLVASIEQQLAQMQQFVQRVAAQHRH